MRTRKLGRQNLQSDASKLRAAMNIDHLIVPRYAAGIAYTTSMATTTSTWKYQVFNTTVFDIASNMANTANDRIDIPIDGVYNIQGNVRWETHATAERLLSIVKNAASTLNTVQLTSDGSTHQQSISRIQNLGAGDYIQLRLWQNSGTTLDSWRSLSFWPYLAVSLLHLT